MGEGKQPEKGRGGGEQGGACLPELLALHNHHEVHVRRFGRNVSIGVILAALVMLIFFLTVVKVTEGDVADAISATRTYE